MNDVAPLTWPPSHEPLQKRAFSTGLKQLVALNTMCTPTSCAGCAEHVLPVMRRAACSAFESGGDGAWNGGIAGGRKSWQQRSEHRWPQSSCFVPQGIAQGGHCPKWLQTQQHVRAGCVLEIFCIFLGFQQNVPYYDASSTGFHKPCS